MAHEISFFDGVALMAVSMSENVFTKPDDDWAPMMFLQGTHDGHPVSPIVPLHTFMHNDTQKDFLAEIVLPAVIKEFKADIVILLFSVWMAKEPEGAAGYMVHGQGEFIQPSARPDRIEAITLAEYTSAGVTRYASAQIIRHEDKPPTLDEWETHAIDSGANYTGRFVEPIVAAMKEVAA
jgi:hypothetical protein